MFYTAYVWFICGTVFFLHYLICFFVLRFFPNATERNYWLASWFLRVGLRLSGIRCVIEGAERIPKDGAFILVSNHQSLVDVVALMAVVPRRFSFVAKKELLAVPVLGWDIRSQGHVPVDRSDPRASAEVLAGLGKELMAGHPLLFFPEGTRSPDGNLLPFKRGSFQLAVNTGVPLVPCYIHGSGKVLPKKRARFKPGTVRIRFGETVPVEKIEDETLARYAARELMRKMEGVVAGLG